MTFWKFEWSAWKLLDFRILFQISQGFWRPWAAPNPPAVRATRVDEPPLEIPVYGPGICVPLKSVVCQTLCTCSSDIQTSNIKKYFVKVPKPKNRYLSDVLTKNVTSVSSESFTWDKEIVVHWNLSKDSSDPCISILPYPKERVGVL